MSGGRYLQYSPAARAPSPQMGGMRTSSMPADHDTSSRYLAELLAERQKLSPFMQVLPNCSRLLNQGQILVQFPILHLIRCTCISMAWRMRCLHCWQVKRGHLEIIRTTGMVSNQGFGDHDRLEHSGPLASAGLISNGSGMDLGGWGGLQSERLGISQASSMGWHGAPGVPISPVVKKLMRLDIPVDNYPNFNFVGRLLGPRGNSLKRVEATTDCRVYIRGRGSVKDTGKEENLRDKPGYEHLKESLHILIEAELPANVIDAKLKQARDIIEDMLKPVDESHDYFKKQQLRELALLNGTLREESPRMSGSVSPFSNSGMKRAKTGR